MKKNESKSRVPVQDRGIRTKERIVIAARELFEKKGYHGTNSKEIAARADVAVGTFYSYYDEKKLLFLDVIREYYKEITEKAFSQGGPIIEALQTGKAGDPKPVIHGLVASLYDAHTISPALHREITSMIYSDPDVEAVTRREERLVVNLIRDVLASISDSLAVNDTEAAARIVHRSVEETIHWLRMFDSDIEDERILRELEDMLYRYLFLKS